MSEQLTTTWKEGLSAEEISRRERFGEGYNRLRALNIALSKTQANLARLKAEEKKKPWGERDVTAMQGKNPMTADRITCTLNLMLRMRGKATTRLKGKVCRACGQATERSTVVPIHAAPAYSQYLTDELIQNFKLQEFLR